ncbi:MAG TPA: hypothetical protein VD864_09785 [Nocardioides sp.]|nr:hypothetical protein [Nocardioides sp.]
MVAVAATASGCAGSQDDQARRVADGFYAAIGSGEGSTACAALAPETVKELEQSSGAPCARALLEEELSAAGEARSVSVFGTMAQVRYADDTVFLARFGATWRVMAAACTPQPPGPYDCRIKGA